MSYTIKEASEVIGVSPRAVRRYIKDGKLSASLVAGKFGEEYSIEVIPPELIKRASAPFDFTPGMAMDIIKGLQTENRNLAGQLGIAQERIRTLENEVKLLTAPKVSWWQRLFSR